MRTAKSSGLKHDTDPISPFEDNVYTRQLRSPAFNSISGAVGSLYEIVKSFGGTGSKARFQPRQMSGAPGG
jgi:hypothetical protein